MFSKRMDAGSPFGCSNAAAVDGRRGNNIYEVNVWLWQLGRGKPRLGSLSFEHSAERKDIAHDAQACSSAAESKRVDKTSLA